MTEIRVCGVPEHFNLPWHLAKEEGAFADKGIDLVWTDVPEGSGRMVRMLEDGVVDLAIVLTEGAIRAYAQGMDIRILQTYVSSPLIWGIHVGSDSPIQEENELRNARTAVSRMGSGSHVMAAVHAERMGWAKASRRYVTVDTLETAVPALREQPDLYFFWERTTTLPFVENGALRCVGEFPSPWPSFVIAVRDRPMRNRNALHQQILNVINRYTLSFKDINNVLSILSVRYGLDERAVSSWLERTEWAQSGPGPEILFTVQHALAGAGIVPETLDLTGLLGGEAD